MTETALKDDYEALTPDLVLNAIEAQGYTIDARFIVLNSYENRVYQVGLEEGSPIIAKFYRPNRWSDEQIIEEHDFTQQLADAELPVVDPLRNVDGQSLFYFEGYRFAMYPRRGGYAPEVGDFDQLEVLGRLLARIHALGAIAVFEHRPTIDVDHFCTQPAKFLLDNNFIPGQFIENYRSTIAALEEKIGLAFENCNGLTYIRGHGDCHVGNVLWTPDHGPHFVDFDDCRMAPAVQDLWMLLAGDRPEQSIQLSILLDAYSDFNDFNAAELSLIEPLRSLRMIQYAGWLARRWGDPAFPANFPWFNTSHYWQQHISHLDDQLRSLDEPPLQWL